MTKELSNAEKLIQLEDKGAAALDNAETPEQRDSIAKNLKKMMGNFTKADRTEAAQLRAEMAKLRAEMEGQDTDEELFPLRKSMGGLMNQSLLDSQDFNKDTGFPSAGIGSSITAKRGSPTTDFPGDQMKKSLIADERQPYNEGSLTVPPEMESDMPVDTYPNIPPEEMAEAEASQLPDEAMEDKHMEFVFEESLDDEEQSYLMNALEGDPRLSQIFDKVLTTASEFTGAGKVEGPGTGVSDSIPARLSDGEFVFTDKATEEIGSDNLQTMMDDAERAYDGGMMRKPAQEGGLLLYEGKDENPLSYEKAAQDEIKKDMLRSNRAPSLNPG